jgi:hypothetical protein
LPAHHKSVRGCGREHSLRDGGQRLAAMPRYLVECTYPNGLAFPVIAGAQVCQSAGATSAEDGAPKPPPDLVL